jgi:MFS family permease
VAAPAPIFVALAATFAAQVLASASSATAPVIAPALALAFAIDTHVIGLYTALLFCGTLISSLVGGVLIPRYGAIRVTQAALLLCATGLTVGTVGGIAGLAACAVLAGCGLGPATPASSHLLARLAPPEWRNIVFSLKQTGVPLGIGLAGVTVPLLTVEFGWRAGFIAVASLCAALALALQSVRARFDDDPQPDLRGGPLGLLAPMRLIFADPAIRPLIVAASLFTGSQGCVNGFLVAALVAEAGRDLVRAGVVLSVALAFGAGARVFWGWVADRLMSPRRVLSLVGVGMTAASLLFLTIAPQSPDWAVIAVSSLMGATAVGWNGVYLAEIARVAGIGRTAEVTGSGSLVGFVGVVVMAPVFTLILELGASYAFGFVVFGTLSGLAALWLARS